MNILSLENISKNFGFRPLFEDVTLGLEDRDKIGIIGANGSGKTTLLRIIAGIEQPDSGRVTRAKGKSLAYLSQNPPFDDKLTVLETIFASSSGVMQTIRDYEDVCHEVAAGKHDDATMQRMSDLQHELEEGGGWEIETNARAVLTRLDITDTHAKMGTLSGGQRKRVALAHELIFKPDILILDEPTNHLDADTIEWLESYLARYTGVLLLVTHDRYFLDRVTDRIFEIDRGTVQNFSGNYAYYLEKKAEQETLREVEGHKREQLIKKELAWLRRGAKARTRKSKHRVEAAHALMAQPKEAVKGEVDIAIGSKRLGSKVIEMNGVSKSYGDITLIDDFTYLLKRDDRIGIIGANGSGKTTLLDMITGRVAPDNGEIEIGTTVHIGYYDQESRALNDEQRVIDYIRDVAEYVTTNEGVQITAGKMLERFLFTPAAQYAVIGNLSGGERRRLYLLRILMGSPNVLLLDEPKGLPAHEPDHGPAEHDKADVGADHARPAPPVGAAQHAERQAMLHDEQERRPDAEQNDRVAVGAIEKAAPWRQRHVFADGERIDIAHAALVEIAVRGVMDGVAALPGIVRRERQHADDAPDPVVGQPLANSAPCPQSCWMRNRRTRKNAAGTEMSSVSQ